jgi:ankyrin repeat protein
LARLLLDAGADPNDGQALYNRMFSRDNSHLDLLFACGLGAGDGGPWHRLLPEITDSPAQLVRGQLAWAVCHGMVDRIVLLGRHGVDLSAPFDQGSLAGAGRTPVALAMTCGRPDIAVLLGRLGAANVELDPATRLVGALLAGDEESAGELIQQAPGLLDEVRAGAPSLILRAAVAGSRSGVELLLDNGFDVNAKGRQDLPIEQEWETALHYAAGEGDLDLVQMLLGAGADPNVRDTRFDATPLGWAENFGKSEVASRLRPVTRT